MRYSSAFVLLALLTACTGGGGSSSAPNAPGAGSPPNYIGTFPLTYWGVVGSCGSSVLPTAINVTATTQGTSNDGLAVTLLTGNLIGGLFDGMPLTNTNPPGPSEQSYYPTAYVLNSNGVFQINVLYGYAPLPKSLEDLNLVVGFSGIGGANVQTGTCEEGAEQAYIHKAS